jgi:hypothetical protein
MLLILTSGASRCCVPGPAHSTHRHVRNPFPGAITYNSLHEHRYDTTKELSRNGMPKVDLPHKKGCETVARGQRKDIVALKMVIAKKAGSSSELPLRFGG